MKLAKRFFKKYLLSTLIILILFFVLNIILICGGKEKRYLRRCMPRLMRRLSQPNPRQLPGGIRRWKNRWLNSGNRCCLAPWQGITTFSNWAATA